MREVFADILEDAAIKHRQEINPDWKPVYIWNIGATIYLERETLTTLELDAEQLQAFAVHPGYHACAAPRPDYGYRGRLVRIVHDNGRTVHCSLPVIVVGLRTRSEHDNISVYPQLQDIRYDLLCWKGE